MSSKQNIIYIYFKGKHLITSKSQYQYNHGQYLYFADLNLPQAFEVHFSNKDKGNSKIQIGSNKLVEIPDEYFWNGALMIYAWIYLHSETTDGETVYEVRIPLIKRAKPTDEEPLPQQQGTIDRAIAELNNAIEVTNENANKTEADKTIVANIKEDVINLKEDIDDTATVVGQKAQETINASERAEASAQNAAQYESNALNYSQQAEQSAQQALESKNIASQKAEVATNASSEALGYRDEALEAKNQAIQAKQNIVDYRDETKGYRDETLTIKNDVQTLKGQIDETAETVNADAQSAEQSANSASQSASQAQEIADTLDNYLYATLSTDVNILALNGKKKTTKAESISVDVAAYKGDERLYITNITGVPIIYRNYITSMAIDYSMYKNNTYGFFRFAYNIENNWEIISDTTTATITITAKDSEENVYTFEKPWTFLIVKDGDVGEDGFSVISLTNSFLIPTDENGIISDVTLLRADFRAYKGGTLINSKVLSAPAITLRDPNNPSVIRNKPWAKTSVASTTTYTSVTLERGYKIASGEHGTYSFTINADGKDVALSIPWIIVKKGDTGESGVYIGTEEPTDESVNVWIDTDETADGVVTDVQVNGTSVVNNGIANIPEIPTSLKYVKDDPSDNGGVVVGHVSENTASGWNAYAEGGGTTASATCSHAEGAGTRATGGQAHSEGGGTLASGNQAHAEGASTIASGDNSHAENLSTTASGACSHASGIGTIAQRKSQFVIGESNVADTGGSTTSDKGDYILIAGNGTSNSNRSNAMTLDWSGNEKLAGSLTLGMNTQNEVTITAQELKALKDDYSSALTALGVI